MRVVRSGAEVRHEITMQRGPPAGIRRIQDEILQVHRDELTRAVEFVRIRAAVGEGVTRQPQAEPQRADLQDGKVEQARTTPHPPPRLSVVNSGERVVAAPPPGVRNKEEG